MAGDVSRRLEGWKEISSLLQRTVRTVQRWERREGLPVHRHVHQAQSSVFAFADELRAREDSRTVRERSPLDAASPLADPGRTFHDAILRGRYRLGTRTREGLTAALRHFQSATALDPASSAAYAHLAECYCALSGNELWAPGDGFPKARAAATRALELDPRCAQAHAIRGMVLNMYDWDWAGSAREFQTAIGLDPTSPVAHHWLGLMLVNAGRPEEAIAPLQRALELDPLSAAITANTGRPLLFLGHYDEAIRRFQKAFDLDPSFWMAHVFTAWAHAAAGRPEAALTAASSADQGFLAARIVLAESLALTGNRAAALAHVDVIRNDPSIRYFSPYRVARVYVCLREIDTAFTWLDRAIDDRSLGSITGISRDPALAPIRSDRRFARYLEAMQLHTLPE